MANSAYGAVGNNGFHYFDYRMAEAITLTGQLSNKHLVDSFNQKINSLLRTSKVDYVIYGDTDSCYINCQPLVDFYLPENKTETNKVISFLDKFGGTVLQKVVNKSVSDVFTATNAFDQVMGCKREVIASKMLFRAKKNYAMLVHDSEGVKYNPPKLKVVGIEVVRSSTPKWCRDKIKTLLRMIFETDEVSFQNKFKEFENEFKTLPVCDIASPKGVSEISKYTNSSGELAGGNRVPMHVRAAALYNTFAKNTPNFNQIQDGDKIKYVYLKMPNPIKENVIGFPTNIDLPIELHLHKYVDYDLQFEKTFENPVKSLTDIAGWTVRKESNLSSFFG